jgi:RimJ/RimL family protein N-acetyltransferase
MEGAIITTERLMLRRLTQEDYCALAQILQDETTMFAYEHGFSDEETQSWLDRQIERYRENGFGIWAAVLCANGEMIGQCGLSWQQLEDRQVLEIGYLFQRTHWKQGYAIEAARACKQYAFETLGAQEVYSIIRENNLASMNVAIRNGMLVRGRFIKHYYGMDMPHYAFCITRAEYELSSRKQVDID